VAEQEKKVETVVRLNFSENEGIKLAPIFRNYFNDHLILYASLFSSLNFGFATACDRLLGELNARRLADSETNG
jgi:hypothetical protein